MHALLFTVMSIYVFLHALLARCRRTGWHGATPFDDMFSPATVELNLFVLLLPRPVRKLLGAGLMLFVSVALIVLHLSFLVYLSRLPNVRGTDVALYAVLLLLLSVSGSSLADFTVAGALSASPAPPPETTVV